ncbi:MAG: hypothetical protein GY910_13385, partial [bacterium]|nr:hypothetical protein [bacterium]
SGSTESTSSTDTAESDDSDGHCEDDRDCSPGEICNPAVGLCEPDCSLLSMQLDLHPRQVFLLVDRSVDMGISDWDPSPDSETPNRYEGIRVALHNTLYRYAGDLAFGLQLFPSLSASSACAGVPGCEACEASDDPELPPAPMNSEFLLDLMPHSKVLPPVGARPVTSAFLSAYSHWLDSG